MTDTLYDLPLRRIDGRPVTLAEHRGKVLLIVNVASRCGLTPQYAGLEALWRERRDDGLVVLGFPANDFREQEPGSDAEIAAFCDITYGVTFPLFSKIGVVGADKHPLYRWLVAARREAAGDGPMRERLRGHGIEPSPTPEVVWNFEKFVVGRDGRVAARFAPDVAADDPRLRAAIDDALAR